MQHLKREQILSTLSISNTEHWIVDLLWGKALNKQIIDWIGEYFIPNYRHSIFSLARKQMLILWELFKKWFPSDLFDFCHIEPDILARFSKDLPSFGWSSSASQLVELVLLFARRYFYRHKIARGSDFLDKEYSLKEIFLGITIDDYRNIRRFLNTCGNDFENIYFELLSMDMQLQEIPIFGKDITFKNDYAYITRKFDSIKKVFPCSKLVSKQLLRLLRSRNIVAEEPLFFGSGKRTIVNKKKFNKKIISFCEAENIPVFAVEALPFMYKAFIMALVGLKTFTFEDVNVLFHLGEEASISLSELELLDNIYEQLIDEKFHFEPSYAPSFLLDIMFPTGLSVENENQKNQEKEEKSRKVGYARGKGKKLEEQIKALKENGCEKIFIDEE